MSIDSVNTNPLGNKQGLTLENKLTRLEIDNAYLTQQNDHLQRELSFARYTINALKTITHQKEVTIDETKLELEKAYLRIKMLGISMMRQQQQQQQQQQHYYHQQAGPTTVDEDKPMLIMDADSSDDQQELSDEDETTSQASQTQPVTRRPLSSILTKLPLRQHPTMVYENQHQPLVSPPTSPVNYNL
ncbi:hypothetical protein BC941DRAFT_474316 [Chlamydoabsidia padenii]|nr:hypothetical protein BC941DRAFT_474316 [Chlamydoabsidia padenii]